MNRTQLLFASLLGATTFAALGASTDTWVGGTGNNFSTTANWSYSSGSGPVASGDSLSFAGAGSTTPNNDETGFTFGGLSFSGSTIYTVGGNDFTLASGASIANSGSLTNIVNNNIALTGSGGIINPSGVNSGITLGGIISGSANLTKNGVTSSVLTLSGVNTFSGVLTFNAGTVIFTTPPSGSGGNLGNPSGITFGGSSTTTLLTSTGAGSVTISSPTITALTSSTALFKNGAASGTTFEISAKLTGAGNCRQNSPSVTGTTVRFSNDTSDFAGNFTMAAGVFEFTSVANGGSASALGAGSSAYAIANSSSAATFRYVGSGNSSTTRNIDWQGTTGGLSLDSSGAGSVQFLGSGNLRSANGIATLTVTGTSTGANKLSQTVNDGPTSGATSVSKTAAGTWTLAGANGHSGGTTLTAGLLNLGNASALGSGTFTISGNGSFDNTTAGLITVANPFTLSGGSPTYIGSSDMTINGAVTISGANRTITVNAGNLTLGGIIGESGSRSLTKQGNGKLTLASSSANTYTGGTAISGGTLQLSGGATLGASGTSLNAGAATLDLGGTSQTLGAVTFSGAGIVQNGTLAGSSFGGAVASGTATIAANLAGGSATVSITGAGSLLLIGTNSYGGGTAFNGIGTVIVTNDAGLGNSTAGVTFNAPGTLSTTNNGSAANNPVTISSSRTITVSSTITAGFATLDTNNLTIASKITGPGNVLKKSSSFSLGTVRFSNDTSDYTGDFTAGFGNTEFTSVADQGTPSSLGVGAVGTGGQLNLANASSSGTLRYVGSGNSSTHRPLNWTATTASGYTLDSSGAGTIQFLNTGVMRTGTGGATTLLLRGSNTGANTLAQIINDLSGTTGLTKNDAGTWVLTAANTFSGLVSLSGGVLQLNAIETPGTSGPLGKNGTISFLGGTLQYSAADNADYSSRFSTAAGQTFRIDLNGQDVTFATPLTNSGGSLLLSNSAAAGSLTLTATNSYTGVTTVGGGTLLVNGGIAGGAVTVTGGSLGGSGAILSPVTIQSAGKLQPGAGGSDIETLSVSNTLSLAGNTIMLLNRTNAQTASRIAGITTLTNGGTLTVTNVGDPLQAGDTFAIFNAAAYVGAFSATNLPALTGNLIWDLSKLSVNGTISVDQPPVAGNLSAAVVENQVLTISKAKLLALCSDPDSDTLIIISAGPTSTNGGAVAIAGPNVTYTPGANYVGADLFTYVVSDGRGGTATGNVTVTVTSGDAPTLNIVSGPSILPNGHFHVGFAGIPDYSYTVQYSPNANGPWTTITNLTAGSEGLFDFEDPTEPAPPSRYYRTTYP